jgi:hypothetical protein
MCAKRKKNAGTDWGKIGAICTAIGIPVVLFIAYSQHLDSRHVDRPRLTIYGTAATILDIDEPVRFLVPIKNVGGGPALHVHMYYQVIYESRNDFLGEHTELAADQGSQEISIERDVTYTATLAADKASRDQLDSIANGQYILAARARVDYTDTDGTPHWFKYCLVVGGANGQIDTTPNLCPFGQGTDTN